MISLYIIIGYFTIAFVIGSVWYAYDWYQWIVHKERDHKFPITSPGSWKTHAFVSPLWLPLMVLAAYSWVMLQFDRYRLGGMNHVVVKVWCEYPCFRDSQGKPSHNSSKCFRYKKGVKLEDTNYMEIVGEHVKTYCGWYNHEIDKNQVNWEYEIEYPIFWELSCKK